MARTLGNYQTQTANYGGVLHWDAFTDAYTSTSYPAIDIELFIKEHSIPSRKKNVSEVNTIRMRDPHADLSRGSNGLFEGSPDLLTLTLTGQLKTSVSSGHYAPKSAAGSAIASLAGYHNGEIVMLLISGELNRSVGGAWIRKDPDYIIDGYGHKYTNPVIQTWESSPVAGVPKAQSFTGTFLLEQ